jgi:hypothetical protein
LGKKLAGNLKKMILCVTRRFEKMTQLLAKSSQNCCRAKKPKYLNQNSI